MSTILLVLGLNIFGKVAMVQPTEVGESLMNVMKVKFLLYAQKLHVASSPFH